MNPVKDACDRLIDAVSREQGVIPVDVTGVGLTEYVLVRRGDVELLLATWNEKRA